MKKEGIIMSDVLLFGYNLGFYPVMTGTMSNSRSLVLLLLFEYL